MSRLNLIAHKVPALANASDELIEAFSQPRAEVCPVCGARGTVPAGFYDSGIYQGTNAGREQCQSCIGLGYIWAPAWKPEPRPFDPRTEFKAETHGQH